jgi:hypothetical protein
MRGKANGVITVKDGLLGNIVARIDINCKGDEQIFTADLSISDGVKPLYFTYHGKGKPDFISIKF